MHFKWVNYVGCELYLNKAVKNVTVVAGLCSEKTHKARAALGPEAHSSDLLAKLGRKAGLSDGLQVCVTDQ